MFKSITKRDIKFFLLGIIFVALIDIIFDWKDFKQGIQGGYNASKHQEK